MDKANSDSILSLLSRDTVLAILERIGNLSNVALAFSGEGVKGVLANSLYTRGHAGLEGVEVPLRMKDIALGRLVGYCCSSKGTAKTREATSLAADLLICEFEKEKDIRGLTEEVLKTYEEINLFYSLSDSLISLFDIPQICDIIIDKIQEVLEVRRASVMLFDEGRDRLYIAAARGISDEVVAEAERRIGEGVSGQVFQKREPILMNDIENFPGLAPRRDGSYSTCSFISAPIFSRRDKKSARPIGVINVADRTSGGIFTTGELKLVSAVASQASLVIQNAILYRNLQKTYNRLRKKVLTIAKMQEELMHSEKLSTMGQLAAVVAHEIRGPLTAITGHAQMIQYLPIAGEDEDLATCCSMIEEGANNINRIIEQLLNYSRESSPEREPDDINDIVEKAFLFTEHYLSRFKRIEVIKELNPDLPAVKVDRGQIQQVFVNMIMNAADAIPEGGTITVQTEVRKGMEVARGLSGEAAEKISHRSSYARISFLDTGVGIPEEHCARIFDYFFTTKDRQKGTGLGLAICRGIINQHGGVIKLQSKVGVGTRFSIYLPVSSE
jgi:signal transduction histidine kinase